MASSFAERLQATYGTAREPDQPRRMLLGPQGNPNSRFGWEVVRAIQQPAPTLETVGPDDVTPNRILSQMNGEHIIFESTTSYEAPTPNAERTIKTPKPPDPDHSGFKSAQRETAKIRKINNHHNRGQRSPQNQGRRR